jgi:riboflavin synthase
MFTGLIEAAGRVAWIEAGVKGSRVRISSDLGAQSSLGDSIAVNGVCLTVVAADASGIEADLSPETLRKTTLGALAAGRRVNLERPVRADARLGGHFVLGHVDGVGRITTVRPEGDSDWIEVELPSELEAGVVPKGSIAIDGISLTVAALKGARVSMQIVPFTSAHTSLGEAQPGDLVNVEVDVLGKYVARLLSLEAVRRS